MLAIVRVVHEASASELETIASRVEPGYFVTQFPKEQITGDEARAEAEQRFATCAKKFKALAELKDKYRKQLDVLGEKLTLPRPGRKTKGYYSYAVVFKLFPTPETWDCFK